MRTFTTAAVTIIFLALAGSASASMHISAQDDGELLANPQVAVQRAQQLGVKHYRVIVRGPRGLDAYQPGIAALHAARIRVDITLTDYNVPAAGVNSPYYPVGEEFVAAAMQRWPYASSWGFWNEPNNDLTPRQYRGVYEAGRRTAAKFAPRAALVFGEVQPVEGISYLRRAIGHGVHADVVAIHPYQFGEAPSVHDSVQGDGIGRLHGYASTLRRVHGVHRKPRLWVTEFGYQWTAHETAGHRGIAARKAATWLAQAFAVARRAGVGQFTVYSVSSNTDSRWDTALLGRDGRPRPVWHTVRHAISANR